MFGFLAALGPIGIAAAVVGTVATVAMSSSSSSSSSSSNRREVEEDYKKNKKDELQGDIENYINQQTRYIKQKYNTDISINNIKVKIINTDKSLNKRIKKVKTSTQEIQQVINILLEAKNEAIS